MDEAVRALGEPEVQHLHQAARADHDVAGLQVAMDDAALVRRLERLRHLHADLQRGFHIERRPCQAGSERLALHQLQHQHHRAAGHFFEPVDGGDVRVVE